MSRASRKAFERVDRHDPTLAVDDLTEFLPSESDSDVDPTLAVGPLHEFFTDDGTGLDTGDLGDYFGGGEHAPTVIADDRAAQDQDDVDVEVVDIAAEDLSFQSEIQRAATDFHRFAEKFHAFASQCQHRGVF